MKAAKTGVLRPMCASTREIDCANKTERGNGTFNNGQLWVRHQFFTARLSAVVKVSAIYKSPYGGEPKREL